MATDDVQKVTDEKGEMIPDLKFDNLGHIIKGDTKLFSRSPVDIKQHLSLYFEGPDGEMIEIKRVYKFDDPSLNM